MKKAVPTVEEIAAKYGWEYAPQRTKGDYRFRKDDIVITFSRLGHGSLGVKWRNFRVPWPSRLKDAAGKEYAIYLTTREEYLDVLLSQVNIKEALDRVEDALAAECSAAETKLRRCQDDIAEFRREAAKVKL